MRLVALTCPCCGGHIASDGKRCVHCGTQVAISSDEKHVFAVGVPCRQCSASNAEKDTFCGSCGAPLRALCPAPGCRNLNSVWRTFCATCGVDLASERRNRLEQAQAELLTQLGVHRRELDSLTVHSTDLLRRKTIARVVVGTLGALCAIGLLLNSQWGCSVILLALTAISVAATSLRGTSKILEESRLLHSRDLRRAESELETIIEELRNA
jgi:hypothetical protein